MRALQKITLKCFKCHSLQVIKKKKKEYDIGKQVALQLIDVSRQGHMQVKVTYSGLWLICRRWSLTKISYASDNVHDVTETRDNGWQWETHNSTLQTKCMLSLLYFKCVFNDIVICWAYMTCVWDRRKMTMEHWWNVTDRGKLTNVLK
jgi:hypothetical protein